MPARSPSEQVQTQLFRALVVLRVLLLLYVLAVKAWRFDDFARPGLLVVLLATMVAWTGVVGYAYDDPRRRRPALFAADVGVAVLLILTTPVVQSQEQLARHASTVPSFWVAGAVLACAAGRPWPQAVAAGAVVSAADLSVRTAWTGTGWGNLFLLVLAAGIVGYTSQVLQRAAEMQAAADRAAAAQAERTRLARAVHDGVLQVLALTQRRGLASGDPELQALGRLAGEQETALRALVQSDARAPAAEPEADLMAALDALRGGPATAAVSVSGPGGPVELPPDVVAEVVAVVAACLDNVRRHVGPDAPAWVLVEDLGSSVVVTVRDEGPGIPDGRLAQARREGRLGVSGSICGRMADLGGRAELVTAPGAGTEWELHVPREVAGVR